MDRSQHHNRRFDSSCNQPQITHLLSVRKRSTPFWRSVAPLLIVAVLHVVATTLTASATDDGTYSHVLTITTFNDSLAAAKEPWALVEFFASWCPACQYFKPEYEQVARLFNSPSSPNSDFIYVAKVDCASDGLLCTRFDVNSYPSMFFGRPSAFSSGERHTDVGKAALEAVTPQERTAQGVLEWINVRTDRMFALPKKGGEEATVTATATAGEPGKAITTSGSGQEDEEQQQLGPRAKLHDIEEATAVAFNFIFTSLPLKKAMRNPLEDFVRLIAQHHPSHRCRNGASVLLRLLPLAWPLSAIGEEEEGKGHGSRKDLGVLRINKTALAGAKICGADLPSGSWDQCSSKIKDRRGYSCGLWLLFHALSVRVGPEQGGWCVNAMRDFVTVFFGCSKCRDHFLQMAQQLHMDKVKTGKDAALWVWRAHNVVNQRLEREEAESGGKRGDPAHPKRQWPTLSLCPLCAADDAMATADSETGAVDPDASWDLEYVHSFLYNFYNEPEGSGRSDAGGDTEGGGRGGGGKAEMVERRGGGGMMMLRSKQKWGGSSYGSHQV
ncbi:unnamed protein product [Closterium sp. NIES-65]|nr:unnamed protein product [Closterium sp. NIES-65]